MYNNWLQHIQFNYVKCKLQIMFEMESFDHKEFECIFAIEVEI